MFNNWKLGRPFGIPTSVHWSFWLLPLFVYFSGSGAMAVIDTAVIIAIFGCVALHELGHALAARQFGVRTRDIVLYPIGGIARLERIPKSPGAEIAIALAGPAVNFAIVALLVPLMLLDGYQVIGVTYTASAMEIFWTKLVWANLVLGIFNLIPAFPMDGGRVLRAALSMITSRVTATEIAATVGTGFAVFFGLGAIFGWPLPYIGTMGPMMIVLAAFLFMIGQAELRAVQAEESPSRQPRGRSLFDIPVAVPVHHADGWVYDPQSREWVLWQHGQIVRRAHLG